MTPMSLRTGLWLTRVNWRATALALAALLVAALWAWALPQAQQRADGAARRTAAQASSDTPSTALPLPDEDTALQSFESRLASDEDLARLMRGLWRYAQAGGVQLSKVDYRSEDIPRGRYRRVTLVVPMNGPYPMVRQVIFSLMAEYPGLALTRLDMKREQTLQPQVEATAHLVLYLKP